MNVVFILIFSILHVAAQESSCTLELVLSADSPCTLEDLDDVVLEGVCLERGFELVQDGNVFSHEQYVEAAKQCLELEAEVSRVLPTLGTRIFSNTIPTHSLRPCLPTHTHPDEQIA